MVSSIDLIYKALIGSSGVQLADISQFKHYTITLLSAENLKEINVSEVILGYAHVESNLINV